MIEKLALYQIIIFLLAASLILRTVFLFLRRKKSIRELLLAIFIWGNLGLIGVYPNITVFIAKVTGFQEGINALIVVCLIILFYTVLSLTLKIDKMENSITRMVRQEALQDIREEAGKLKETKNLKLIDEN